MPLISINSQLSVNFINQLIGRMTGDKQLFPLNPVTPSIENWLSSCPLLSHLKIQELFDLSINNELFTLLIPQRYLQTLTVEDTGIQSDAFWFLFSSFLQRNTRLESLSMNLCAWSSTSFYHVAIALHILPHLKILNLSGNDLSQGPLLRGFFSKKTILSLELEHCSIDDNSLVNWLDEIKQNPNLIALNLGLNPITDDSFNILFDYITLNKNLTFLSLDRTRMSLEKIEILMDLIHVRKLRLHVGLDALILGNQHLLSSINRDLVFHHCSMIPLLLKGLVNINTALLFKEYYRISSSEMIEPTTLLMKLLNPDVGLSALHHQFGSTLSIPSPSLIFFSSTPFRAPQERLYRDNRSGPL